MRKVFILGNKGNMGQRYKAVLDYLFQGKISVSGADVDDSAKHTNLSIFDFFIIATPTNRHIEDIYRLIKYQKPILCEKPIAKSYKELIDLEKYINGDTRLLSMVNQYEYMKGIRSGWPKYHSCYNYYKSGKDGLAWDCINIIGLSKAKPILEDNSPVWQCVINGRELNIAQMDMAYVLMLKDFIMNNDSNWEYAKKATKKVEQWLMY